MKPRNLSVCKPAEAALLLISLLVSPFAFANGIPAPEVDTAEAYSTSTWRSNAHKGGYNWGNWVLESSASGGAAGHMIADSTLTGGMINTGGKSFGMYADPASTNAFAAAARYFATPTLTMTTGDVLSFQMVVNFRNGSKGFNLRDAAGNNVWLFNVGRENNTGGYYIRNGPSSSASLDNGQRLGPYHANTVFTFTFTQTPRTLDWVIERSGGISDTLSGSAPLVSGTVAALRFFISRTDPGWENNLFFNNFYFQVGDRRDAPLTLGERRLPGAEASYLLRFSDPAATRVTMRHGGDWNTSHELDLVDNVWQIDIRGLGLSPGWHSFKFRLNGSYESGSNRRLYIDEEGRVAYPPALYLTWQRDPDTTMTVQWHTQSEIDTGLRYRAVGDDVWTEMTADGTVPFPYSGRLVHTCELVDLIPDTDYEFEVDGYPTIERFRTMPSVLSRPIRFIETGDILFGSVADTLAQVAGATDPDFMVIGGDLAYSDGRADLILHEYYYFESFFKHLRAPDGRMIPMIVGVGNHEMKNHYLTGHQDFEPTAEWRERVAPYFFKLFAFPGHPGYGVIDFGNYLSFIFLDTNHLNMVVGTQADWLEARLDERRSVPHLFPVQHVPSYPSHRSLNDSLNTTLRNTWVPLYEQAGVQLVFEHHDHAFKRTPAILGGQLDPSGIVYLGDGAWGVSTRPPHNPATTWFLEKAEQRHHFYLVTLTGQGRMAEAIDVNGHIFDTFVQGVDGIPPTPQVSVSQMTDRRVALEWPWVERAHGYEVRRDGVTVATLAATETSFVDFGLAAETAYLYTVYAFNRSGHSPAFSLPLLTHPAPALPGTPGAPRAWGISGDKVQLTWQAVDHAESYVIYRDDELIAEVFEPAYIDTGLTSGHAYAYTIVARNSSGDSGMSSPREAGALEAHPAFILDGEPESSGYLLADSGMTLYAALRGTELYVATWSPAGGQADHFIFVSDHLLEFPFRRSPWAKMGMSALPQTSPYLGAESESSYISWFNAPDSATAFRSGVAGGKMEGVIDLVSAFGSMPTWLYLAAAAYGTEDGGLLLSQVPAGNNDAHFDPEEFLAVPLGALRDTEGQGGFDRLDPARSFRAGLAGGMESSPFTIRWQVVPGRQYRVWRSGTLAPDSWILLTPEPLTAPSGSDVLVFEEQENNLPSQAFYRVEVLP